MVPRLAAVVTWSGYSTCSPLIHSGSHMVCVSKWSERPLGRSAPGGQGSEKRWCGRKLGGMADRFVPDDFTVPEGLAGRGFRLEPLGPAHNDRDYDAWMSSIDHIRATPGFPDGSWPSPMSLEDNLADLRRHADDFAQRAGFTYSVLDDNEVIGCVYIYPTKNADHDASAQSWVRASRADMDLLLWEAIAAWLETDWPFANIDDLGRS